MTTTGTEPASDRRAWLKERRKGMGASDVAAVLGISPWASPWSVWADKSELIPIDDDVDDDDPREFGRRAENMIGPWFTARTGLHVTVEQRSYTHPLQPWMMATPDGAVWLETRIPANWSDRLEAIGGLEIKTEFAGGPWDVIPAHHQAQGQWQMAVTGWQKIWFAVLHGRRFRTYELDRDDADIEFMVDRVEQFWVHHVQAGVPPELDGHAATLAAVEAIYPETIPKTSIDIDDVAGAIDMWQEAQTDRKDATGREEAAKATIKWAMAENYEGTVHGDRAVTLGQQTRKTTCGECGAVDESEPFRVLRLAKGFKA